MKSTTLLLASLIRTVRFNKTGGALLAEHYQISEFSSFITGHTADGYITLPERTFQSLQRFLLENKGKKDALEFMSISARRGLGTVITAQNYVGLIAMQDGSTIEILPKIYSGTTDPDGSFSRKILLDMLKTLPDTPFKSIQSSSMQTAKMPLLEIFIRRFLDELLSIVKHGLRCNYDRVESNETFCKGQLVFSEHIRHNFAHQERNYIRYDLFNSNCPENRILKATLQILYRRSSSARNRRDMKVLLSFFENIPASIHYDRDFSDCSNGRDVRGYNTALSWARVFLTGKSFTAYAGSDIALALLYPMEILFERYIARRIKQQLDPFQYSISIQETGHYLFEQPEKRFSLRPDIVIRRHCDNAVFILDTKWKLLSQGKPNYGISQSDMYQMYAYQKKYSAVCVTLIYPQPDQIPTSSPIFYKSKGDAQVTVNFIKLTDAENSITALLHSLEQIHLHLS